VLRHSEALAEESIFCSFLKEACPAKLGERVATEDF